MLRVVGAPAATFYSRTRKVANERSGHSLECHLSNQPGMPGHRRGARPRCSLRLFSNSRTQSKTTAQQRRARARSETQGRSTEPTEATMQLYLTEGGALLQTPRASQKFNLNLNTLFRQLGSPRPLRSTRRSGAPPKRGAGRCWLQRHERTPHG